MESSFGVENSVTAQDNIVKQLGKRAVLVRILRDCTDEFKNMTLDQIANEYIVGEPQLTAGFTVPDAQHNPIIKGAESEMFFDVIFDVSLPDTKEKIRLIIKIDADPSMPKAIFHTSDFMADQADRELTHQEEHIRKVYSIWITINKSAEEKPGIRFYDINETQLAGNFKADKEDYDLFSIRMLRLSPKASENPEGVLRFLAGLLVQTESVK